MTIAHPSRQRIVVTAAIAVTTMRYAGGPVAGAACARARGERITVTTTTCAPRWRAPNAGRDHFALVNDSGFAATIYLFHAIDGDTVTRVKNIKPHTVHELVVRLVRGGHYMWGCDLRGRPPRTSEVQTVPLDPNHGGLGPPVVPVTRDELVPAMQSYRHYVTHELAVLTPEVTQLGTDLAGDDTTAAESDWLVAHQTWLRIGQDDGAYGAFGELGREIDGTAAGLVHGTADPHFTGFHKVEFDLWTKDNLAAASAATRTLSALIARISKRGLASWLPLSIGGVTGLTLRSHEILEDALRDSLSGDDDYGSGTSLASVHADVAGTREVLGLLQSLLTPRAPHLVPHARRALKRLVAALMATQSHGTWVAVTAISLAKREKVNSAIGAALEILSRVPDLLAIGNT